MDHIRRVLFVCEGNLHRSPTAATLYSNTPGLKTRSAGLANSARVQVTEELLEWADVVFIMERRLRSSLRRRFGNTEKEKIVCLDIPDDFQCGEPELIAILTERLSPHLRPPVKNHDEDREQEGFA